MLQCDEVFKELQELRVQSKKQSEDMSKVSKENAELSKENAELKSRLELAHWEASTAKCRITKLLKDKKKRKEKKAKKHKEKAAKEAKEVEPSQGSWEHSDRALGKRRNFVVQGKSMRFPSGEEHQIKVKADGRIMLGDWQVTEVTGVTSYMEGIC